MSGEHSQPEARPTDLVYILRRHSNPNGCSDVELVESNWTGDDGLFCRAAAEIERLQGKLSQVKEWIQKVTDGECSYDKAYIEIEEILNV